MLLNKRILIFIRRENSVFCHNFCFKLNSMDQFVVKHCIMEENSVFTQNKQICP